MRRAVAVEDVAARADGDREAAGYPRGDVLQLADDACEVTGAQLCSVNRVRIPIDDVDGDLAGGDRRWSGRAPAGVSTTLTVDRAELPAPNPTAPTSVATASSIGTSQS